MTFSVVLLWTLTRSFVDDLACLNRPASIGKLFHSIEKRTNFRLKLLTCVWHSRTMKCYLFGVSRSMLNLSAVLLFLLFNSHVSEARTISSQDFYEFDESVLVFAAMVSPSKTKVVVKISEQLPESVQLVTSSWWPQSEGNLPKWPIQRSWMARWI